VGCACPSDSLCKPARFGQLEQVHVTGITRRGLRLEWMAALGVALLIPAAYAQNGPQTATRATLTVDGRGEASVSVSDIYDRPAGGVVSIEEEGRILAQSLLDGEGQAQLRLSLPGGEHTLKAVYAGDSAHLSAVSAPAVAHPETPGGVPGFSLSVSAVAPATLPMSLTAGQSGSVNVTITPVNNGSLTAPMFTTLSCSGLPSNSSCSFAPEDVEILPTTPTSCTTGSPAASCPPVSLMVIETVAQTGELTPGPRRSNPVAWAILLPGFLALGGIAFGARRRRWLQRMALVALIGLVTTLGTTACSPLYQYYNHGPPITPATPSGTYTVTITAESANGVTALDSSTTMVLTIK